MTTTKTEALDRLEALKQRRFAFKGARGAAYDRAQRDFANNAVADIDFLLDELESARAANGKLRDVLRKMLADVEAYQANPYGHSPTSQIAAARAVLAETRTEEVEGG